MIEKYKALEAENERLKALNVELTAKCNWYNRDGARLERERDELTRQLSECKADAAKWRAHQKRKQEVIAAGMGRKILRDIDDAVNELQQYISAGYKYQLRELYEHPPAYKEMLPAAPKGD